MKNNIAQTIVAAFAIAASAIARVDTNNFPSINLSLPQSAGAGLTLPKLDSVELLNTSLEMHGTNLPASSFQGLMTDVTKPSLRIFKPGSDTNYCLQIIKPLEGTNFVIQTIR